MKKRFIRQKTHGWKNQNTNRWPFKRSPTHKSRTDLESHDSRGSNKFKMKVNSIVSDADKFTVDLK